MLLENLDNFNKESYQQRFGNTKIFKKNGFHIEENLKKIKYIKEN